MKFSLVVVGALLMSVSSCSSRNGSVASSSSPAGTVSSSTTVPKRVEECVDQKFDDCIIGYRRPSSASTADVKVAFGDGILVTFGKKNDVWTEISRQDISQLAAQSHEPSVDDPLYVDMGLLDVTADDSSELLLRLGPTELLLAAQSRDLAVFRWSTSDKRWKRLYFPIPKFEGRTPLVGDESKRLLRWGYAKDGLVYEEVGYTDLDGHIDDKSFVYQWNGSEFKQIRIVNLVPACLTVSGDESSLCMYGIN
ncbi:MAG: hypothetical protein RLZ67_1161 [Actinomycetota bacterium]|jgi:hypothetical protein